jgi:hypothetical protein
MIADVKATLALFIPGLRTNDRSSNSGRSLGFYSSALRSDLIGSSGYWQAQSPRNSGRSTKLLSRQFSGRIKNVWSYTFTSRLSLYLIELGPRITKVINSRTLQ